MLGSKSFYVHITILYQHKNLIMRQYEMLTIMCICGILQLTITHRVVKI